MAGRVHARSRLATPTGVSVREQLADDPDLLATRWKHGGRTVAVMNMKRQAAQAKLPRDRINTLARLAGQSPNLDRAQEAVGDAFPLPPGGKKSGDPGSSSGSGSSSSGSGKRRGRPRKSPPKSAKQAKDQAQAEDQAPKDQAREAKAKSRAQKAKKGRAQEAPAQEPPHRPPPAPLSEEEMRRLRVKRLPPEEIAKLNLPPPKTTPKKAGVGGSHLF